MSDLPRPSRHHPRRALLRALRPVLGTGIARWWDLRVHGADDVPVSGPVIFASNHAGWLDGPLLAMMSPRPVHALTKQEMFDGLLGTFLTATGQIPLNRFSADPSAIKTCLRVLADGGAIGIFPEGTRGAGELEVFHHGAAFLALVSGAPVVPVTQVGTRLPGGGTSSIPPRGSRIDMLYGEAWRTARTPWPRTREQTLATSALLWDHLRQQQSRALALVGRDLPGPLPPGDAEIEPDTGFVEHSDHHHDIAADNSADQQGAS
ncbi:lysophospholipid acyltransferase family protein [Nocardioides sp.]|uniref:lysophospholipid acyltransferase family protein n=1 Tax=Nocardioides sp. TaxID=35761 RepID=UPI002C11FD35|nr:lysophospholipid acyltransferase family protein [Nocardioides sp.]HXH77738.1 lysophospholipid acyltransferase family protein [Nocardioides sp.]